MKKATLKDIAQEAGVSAMTVSKALNNQRGVSETTRLRIQKIAKQLNYSQNLVAKGLRVSETRTVGVVLSDSSEMVMTKILHGIQDVTNTRDYSVIIANTNRNVELERNAIKTLVSKRIDGLLLVAPGLYLPEDVEWLQSLGIPFTMLMRQNEESNVDTVINDNYLGGYQCVEHLVQQGCKSFLFVLIEHSLSSQERLKGYTQALRDYKIPNTQCRFLETKSVPEAGYNMMYQVASELHKYDAVVCACDTMAIGAMEALLEMGLNIPEDICLMGYDGIDFAKYLRVPLSTIAQPLYQIGSEGMEVLLDRIKYPDTATRKLVLKSELIVRQSTMRKK